MLVTGVRPHNLSEESEQMFYKVCSDLALPDKVIFSALKKYTEPHRYYHTLDHICNILKLIEGIKLLSFEKEMLYYAAIFHDIVYDPKYGDNEEKSVKLMYKLLHDAVPQEILTDVENIILSTKKHNVFNTSYEELFCKFDLNEFEQSFQSVLEDEKKIRKEYAFVDWSDYQKGREKALTPYLNCDLLSNKAKANIRFEIDYLSFHQPKIAVYAGSFSPLHIGHLNILQKAEQIFDKVIIAVGQNPEKKFKVETYNENLCEALRYKQVDFYEGLLTDYLKSKSYPLTVIRGLRNITDLQTETVQYRWLQDLMPDINLVSIFCDREYEHVSSSGIKILQEYNNDLYKKYIVE